MKTFKDTMFGIVVALLVFVGGRSYAFDGTYRGISGKVGIYTMDTMVIQKNSDGKTFTVVFKGERSLTYDDASVDKGNLQISDKGFMLDIQFDGKRAVVDPDDGKAVFEKVDK